MRSASRRNSNGVVCTFWPQRWESQKRAPKTDRITATVFVVRRGSSVCLLPPSPPRSRSLRAHSRCSPVTEIASLYIAPFECSADDRKKQGVVGIARRSTITTHGVKTGYISESLRRGAIQGQTGYNVAPQLRR